MYKNKKILAVVMARGGSKGIINKNLRLNNKKNVIQERVLLKRLNLFY